MLRRALVLDLSQTLAQSHIVGLNLKGKAQVAERVFMTAIQLRGVRQCHQFLQTLMHLLGAALEQAPTAASKQGVTGKQMRCHQKGNVVQRVTGGGEDDSFCPQTGQRQCGAICHCMGNAVNGLITRPIHWDGMRRGQRLKAADVVTVMVGNQQRSQGQRLCSQKFLNHGRITGIDDDAVAVIMQRPDVVVIEGGQRGDLKDRWVGRGLGHVGCFWYAFGMSKSSVARPASLANFALLQAAESRLLQAALATVTSPHEGWIEFSPVNLPSPALAQRRERILFDAGACCWPFGAKLDQLPLADECVGGILLRHLWQPAMSSSRQLAVMTEVMRVLRPGGVCVSISASPFHRRSWQVLGLQGWRLPTWLGLQRKHQRVGLSLTWPSAGGWSQWLPAASPLIIVVARKPARPVPLSQRRRIRQPAMTATTLASQCRAA